jgi:outer membrane lipoprotein-sorting protein
VAHGVFLQPVYQTTPRRFERKWIGSYSLSVRATWRSAVVLHLALLAGPAALAKTDERVRALREQAHKVNGFTAELSVSANGTTQSGTLLFLAPDRVHMEMKIPGLGNQNVISDGRTLWTITPDARVATKIDLVAVQKSWHRPLANQATAIRDVFGAAKPGTIRWLQSERISGIATQKFEAVPEIGVDAARNARVPDRMQFWVGDDGLLRRQVLLRGNDVLMDAHFTIVDKNPHIPAGQFSFHPPSGYEVKDMTKSTLESLRALEKG